jgi:hypothetical protein
MELHQYKNLLDQVNAINARYKKINELTGENFNVFRILKLDSSEVRMHSAFIAELLNPDGSHGQKDIFLSLFIKVFCFKNNPIDAVSCKVKVEDYIGQISEDKMQGGRIDIIIRDKYDHQIVIENKIYARDQEHQLSRYFNNSSMADIIYLTLDGKPPSDNSKGEMIEGEHYKCASYKQDILNWLELCRKEVAIYPIVREALSHYINLIKYLTNQTLNHNMEEELSDIMKSYIEESFAISNNLDRACQKVSDDFGKAIKDHFEKIGMQCLYEIDFEERYSGIYIWRPEWKHLSIAFAFQYYDKDMIYGFLQEDPTKFEIPEKLRSEIYSLPGNSLKSSDWWPWYKKLESPFNNWKELGAWQAILNGKMKDMVIEKVQFLLNLTEDIEL